MRDKLIDFLYKQEYGVNDGVSNSRPLPLEVFVNTDKLEAFIQQLLDEREGEAIKEMFREAEIDYIIACIQFDKNDYNEFGDKFRSDLLEKLSNLSKQGK